jgi:D-alanyl-D-alanine carboxypeptidase/D-alanyl-D-alanine-endopeptidase (penicillin-binding protein 4)
MAAAADVAELTLARKLGTLFETSPVAARSSAGVHVVDLSTGKTVFARNENRLFLPASNLKIATSALALERLGPDYRFITRLVQEPSGDLVLIGSGDPSLSGRMYPYVKPNGNDKRPNGRALLAIEELADQAVAAGLRRVDGDVIGDDRVYPWSPYPASWTQEDALNEDGAPVSALSVNDNVVTLTVLHGAQPGDPAVVQLNPALEYFAIDNRTATVAGTQPGQVRIARLPGTRQLQLWGSVPANGAMSVTIAVDDPALFAACALYDALLRRGVTVRGQPAARHRSVSEDQAPVAGRILASRTSPPLAELLQVVDKVSQNLHAELILRETGRVTRQTGTVEAGLDALAAFLMETGAARDEFALQDGSGLSRNAQVTPRLLTRVLARMYRSPQREAWMDLLPVGGEDGTLQFRMTCCRASANHIHAKTGTLARAVALSGYADRGERGVLAFSILVNNFSAPAGEVRAWVDKIALTLAE